MITMSVQVSGDHWVNQEEITHKLQQCNDAVELDMGAEGVSLAAVGIDVVVLEHCARLGIDPKRIRINSWPNSVEEIPFTRMYNPRLSHFFWMSQSYWQDAAGRTGEHRFGLFVGRKTLSRGRIVYDMHSRDCLLSVMAHEFPSYWDRAPQGFNAESNYNWLDDHAKLWWSQCNLSSIDGFSVKDQYDTRYNTNASLLKHYHRFDVEIVAETYTLGETFFPTEKTVRPLMAVKPVLVYGPKRFLSRLRDLGFKTFGDCWDESYDDLEGPARWQAMKQQIDLIGSSQIEQAYEIANFNREHLELLIKKYKP